MKIYTGKGDQGESSLFGGRRVPKSSPRLQAVGDVDELNTVIGLILSEGPVPEVQEVLRELQPKLFVLGADLATPAGAKAVIERIGSGEIRRLEEWIDLFEESLPPLRHFILPGGSRPGALLHMARAVCRRAERSVVACAQQEPVSEEGMVWLNRLSDLLFVLARTQNHRTGQSEEPWTPRG